MKILPIAVLAAVLLYFAVQLYNYLSDPVSTTLVTEGQAEDTIALNGWLLRDEEVLPAQSGTLLCPSTDLISVWISSCEA